MQPVEMIWLPPTCPPPLPSADAELRSFAEEYYGMVMAAKTHRWTRADLDRLPNDGNRYEVLDGALFVTPLPLVPHERVVGRLRDRLSRHCADNSLGEVFSPAAVPHGKNELQPDISVVLGPPDARAVRWSDLRRPSLVIEVLSDSTRQRDLIAKRSAYLDWGIPEYWIVDRDERSVRVVRANRPDEIVRDVLRWQSSPDLPALQIDVAALFG